MRMSRWGVRRCRIGEGSNGGVELRCSARESGSIDRVSKPLAGEAGGTLLPDTLLDAFENGGDSCGSGGRSKERSSYESPEEELLDCRRRAFASDTIASQNSSDLV